MSDRLSQTEVASRLSLSTRQVHNLVELGVIEKRVTKGKSWYPWPDTMRAYITWKVAQEVAKSQPTNIDEARRRKEMALAEKAELEVAQMRGELLSLETHEKRVESLLGPVAARLIGLDRYIADVQRAMTAVEAKAVLDRVSDDLLRALYGVADEIDAENIEDEPAETEAPAA